ncbi:MAG: hypothetical protein NXI01_01370 [Gammaproteobacteria bacterium]|nr:hypothetical protein [Gammaproteobacteria bacterium]
MADLLDDPFEHSRKLDEVFPRNRLCGYTKNSDRDYKVLIDCYGVPETLVSDFKFAVARILVKSYAFEYRLDTVTTLRDRFEQVPAGILALMKDRMSNYEKETEIARRVEQFCTFCEDELATFYYDDKNHCALVGLKKKFTTLYNAVENINLNSVVPLDTSDDYTTEIFDKKYAALVDDFDFSASEEVVSEFRAVVAEVLLRIYRLSHTSDVPFYEWQRKFGKVPENILDLMEGEEPHAQKELEIARQVEDFCALYDAYLPSFYKHEGNHPTIVRLKSALTSLYDAAKPDIFTIIFNISDDDSCDGSEQITLGGP